MSLTMTTMADLISFRVLLWPWVDNNFRNMSYKSGMISRLRSERKQTKKKRENVIFHNIVWLYRILMWRAILSHFVWLTDENSFFKKTFAKKQTHKTAHKIAMIRSVIVKNCKKFPFKTNLNRQAWQYNQGREGHLKCFLLFLLFFFLGF